MVRDQIEKVIACPDFDASRSSRELLRFIAEETLAGRGNDLTPSAIARGVFRRGDDFDPVADPIVRIQTGRLRRALERHYRLCEKHDAVRIGLARGSYVPFFVIRNS
jgi:adenylate cyclase